MDGALLRAALVASCFLGALPPVDLRAVCLVRAITGNMCYTRVLSRREATKRAERKGGGREKERTNNKIFEESANDDFPRTVL